MEALPRSMIQKGMDMDVSDIHIARYETDQSHAYIQDQNVFMAAKIFPISPATQITGYIARWRKDAWYRRWAGKWQPGDAVPISRIKPGDKLRYDLDWIAVGYPLPKQFSGSGIADPAFNIDDSINRLVTNTLLIEREFMFADTYFKPAVWGLDYTGVSDPGDVDPASYTFLQFDQPGSDPRGVISTFKRKMDRKAMEPNVALMSYPVFEVLRVHKQLLQWAASFQKPGTAISELNEDWIAQALGLDKVLVARAKYADSAEGADEDDITLDYILNKQGLMLAHVEAPGLLTANAGQIVSQNFDMQVPGGVDLAVERIPILETHVEKMQGFMCMDMVQVGKDLGLFAAETISANAANGLA